MNIPKNLNPFTSKANAASVISAERGSSRRDFVWISKPLQPRIDLDDKASIQATLLASQSPKACYR
ncbi:MAG: hypothetical protein EBR00_10910 [Gammaproteobacteria bacterium]|nr:hypothetical protein [Gammaproteobacteria bacterium]